MPPTGHDATCQPAAVDEGLRCLSCDYNLTGLPGGACPECGAAFDPTELCEIRAGRKIQPIPIWDEVKDEGYIWAWLQVAWRVWFSPIAFGRTFPRCSDEASAEEFRRRSYWIAFTLFTLFVSVLPMTWIRPAPMLGLIPLLWLGARICEHLVLGVFAAALEDNPYHTEQQTAYHLTCFTSCHLLLSLVGTCLATLATGGQVVLPCALGFLLFWWIGVAGIAWGRVRSFRALAAVAMLTPVAVAMTSLAIGVVAAGCAAVLELFGLL